MPVLSDSHSSVRVLLALNLTVSLNAMGTTRYVGRGRRKSYAKDSAAHGYLVVNQVILPPPLSPEEMYS
jgi:hypothetical protein